MSVAAETERVEGEVVEGNADALQLSLEEARQLTDEARELAQELWRRLLRLYEGGAHTALGYSNWADYFNTEFRQGRAGKGIDPKDSYKFLRAARVEAWLTSVLVNTGGMTRAQALLLHQASEEERLALAGWVEEQGGWERVAATRLQRELDRERGNLGIVESQDVPELEITAYDRHIAGTMYRTLRYLLGALELLRENRPPRLSHFVLPAALRALPTDEARKVREKIAEERRHVNAIWRALAEIDERLELAEYVLDGRNDVSAPTDQPQGVQVTVEEMVAEVAAT